MKIEIIAAIDNKNGLSRNGIIPFSDPADRKLFRILTQNKIVVMGNTTFKNDFGCKPLSNRQNYVMTRTLPVPFEWANGNDDGVTYVNSVKKVLDLALTNPSIVIIGGSEIYELFMEVATDLYISTFIGNFDCDTRFPEIDRKQWKAVDGAEYDNFYFTQYEKRKC